MVSYEWEDVPVMMQRCYGVSATVKVPQIQFIAESEDLPVMQQRRRRTVHTVQLSAGRLCGGGGIDEGGAFSALAFFALLQVLELSASEVAGTPGVVTLRCSATGPHANQSAGTLRTHPVMQ